MVIAVNEPDVYLLVGPGRKIGQVQAGNL